jgi:hypothetical protein
MWERNKPPLVNLWHICTKYIIWQFQIPTLLKNHISTFIFVQSFFYPNQP